MADAFGHIDLPKLQSLTLIDLSIALPRINAPSLRNVTVCNVYLGMSQGTAGGVSSNPQVEAAARETVLGFLLRSAKSLESAQLHARVVLEKDIAARSSPTDSSHTIFPRLTSMSLCLDDYISELIDAPNLRHLEIRQPLDERGPHPDHSRFATAETLVLADTSTLDVVWAGTNSMKNVRQLQIRRDPSQLGRLNEIFFLRSLSTPRPAYSEVEALELEQWLFPKLHSIDLHFALSVESFRLQDPALVPEVPSWDTDFDSNSSDESCDISSPSISDRAEYYSRSSQWSLSTDDIAHLNNTSTAENIDGCDDAPGSGKVVPQSTTMDIDHTEGTPPSEHSSGSGGASDLPADVHDTDMESESDIVLKLAREPWGELEVWHDARASYGYFLHALQGIVMARKECKQVLPLESVKISTGRRVLDDFAPPKEIRSWFEANVPTFEAPT